MADPHKKPSDILDQNALPDVVHSQQALTLTTEADAIETNAGEQLDSLTADLLVASITESISEHLPSEEVDSPSESHNDEKAQQEADVQNESEHGNVSETCTLNIPLPYSPTSENYSSHDPSKSCLHDTNVVSDMNHISEESPINLDISSDISKDATPQKRAQLSPLTLQECAEHESEDLPKSDKYDDSLNEEYAHKSHESEKSSGLIVGSANNSPCQESSGSEEIIKLDIRGQGASKFCLPTAKIIFGPPPQDGAILDPNIEAIPVFQNLLSPFLVGARDSIKVKELFDLTAEHTKEPSANLELSPEKSAEISLEKQSSSSDKDEEQKDLLIEELTVDDIKEKEDEKKDLPIEELTVDDIKETEDEKHEDPSLSQSKSVPPDEPMSFSTMTTDYKTLCEDYNGKLVHLEDAITKRDELIEELTISLQRAVHERNELKFENEHLTDEVQHLQHIVGEKSLSEHDTIKAQLSDFVKYQSMIKDDSTKFYSALMSGGTSLHSSNGEKDMDHEEITVNYSKSDPKSSGSSGEFQTGFENKLSTIINKFDDCIEENMRNKLRESIIQILYDEISKLRIESATEVKELECQMQQEKQTHESEARRLRELLASVKAGDADVDALRQELGVKHEKEMENLRTYFEKKCTDMERSYSEEVWRGRACASSGSASPADPDAAGDRPRRRTRSAELPSLSLEWSPLEPARQASRRLSPPRQLEEARAEHAAFVRDLQAQHLRALSAQDLQISQLKALISTSETADANVSVYQQDIDLELEKDPRFQRRVEEVRQEVIEQLQAKIQVLLSDPDAEVSSWPLELVALRDRLHGDARQQEKEPSSLREELSAGEDKWRQRRHVSFDQNRRLEEVTKERDGLKRVAASLHRAVSQLAAYCARAEDELNGTVLRLLCRGILDEDSGLEHPLELETSLAAGERRVHFAPDLRGVLAELDESALEGFLREERASSLDLRQDLDSALRRLRREAQDLLQLSCVVGNKRNEAPMLESSQVQITELVQELDAKQNCDNCELNIKNMEEVTEECLQREKLLRSDLDAAMMKIAELMVGDREHSTEVVAEGYGTGQPEAWPRPLYSAGGPAGPGGASSLDALRSPERRAAALAQDLDVLLREKEDLAQQLEVANRQLRAARQFLEEQAAEREGERDEAARQLAGLRQDNARLAARLQANARVLGEVEQLENQAREMNQMIAELETRKAAADEDSKAKDEKISLLRDIIANLESQVEQKSSHEAAVLKELETMRQTIDERDAKMRALLAELEALRAERAEQSEVMCAKCAQDEEKYAELNDRVKEQCQWVEERLAAQTAELEQLHAQGSQSCSEPSEDVSLRDRRPRQTGGAAGPGLAELVGVWEAAQGCARAASAGAKRARDLEMTCDSLRAVAQELRAERDVLQTRLSEQALQASSLAARLQRHRNDAAAAHHDAAAAMAVRLHDAGAEVEKLKEDLESKDKQLMRLKQTLAERDKTNEYHQALYGNSCDPKDKVVVLERELSSAQGRIGQLEGLVRSLELDKERLQAAVRDHQRLLAEKDDQLQEMLALKLDEESQNEEKSEAEAGKVSARTLSDIVSISDFDEDLQMRRALVHPHNVSLNPPFPSSAEKAALNRTLPPDLPRPDMSSLQIDRGETKYHDYSPRADSLPAHLTSTQKRDIKQHKRNTNETTVFGGDKFGDSLKHSTAHNIPDNCSMYPNRDVSDSLGVTVEPKVIDFSAAPTDDNKTRDEISSLQELGIDLDLRRDNLPEVLCQLKQEIKKSRSELETCKSELKNAEEQLCEFPALKEEVEELKGLLENTMGTMNTDKKFYENQLENFSSNKKLLEQRLAELTQEVNEKSKDLHLLKEDILRRENMILELAKEKRSLTNKMADLELNLNDLQSRNSALGNTEIENRQLREKLLQFEKLEQLVSEKNQQIDSLNQHLDRLDDLQRCLNDKTEEFDNLKELYEEKSREMFQIQETVTALNRDIAKLTSENNELNDSNKDLKLRLSKLEKEQENASLKLEHSEGELERLNSINGELTSKIDELKLLNEKLRDKETEIEILNEDINAFHEEITTLKEQLQMVSRSPSPKTKGAEEKKAAGRQSNDMKQLVKIRKQISLLQHELDFNKKELNDKAFELAKAKLDLTEARNAVGLETRRAAELTLQLEQRRADLDRLRDREREEGEVSELRAKLRRQDEQCRALEARLLEARDLLHKQRAQEAVLEAEVQSMPAVLPSAGRRSPTAELEAAVRTQLHHAQLLDRSLAMQILSASSDEHEDIPRLVLNSSNSRSTSPPSSSSERERERERDRERERARSERERLQSELEHLRLRLRDKDALISELCRVRDKAAAEAQSSALRLAAEREQAARLQALLRDHQETAHTLQSQDSHVIQMLQARLESALQVEAELRRQLDLRRAALAAWEGGRPGGGGGGDGSRDPALRVEMEKSERLRDELSVVSAQLQAERERVREAVGGREEAAQRARAEARGLRDRLAAARAQCADLQRSKHETSMELVRAKELLTVQADTIVELERKLSLNARQRCYFDSPSQAQTGDKLRDVASPHADHRDQAVRYLHGRCLRLESGRKALVWQKRYLQRALAGYKALDRLLRPADAAPPPSPLRRFRCAALAVAAALRMRFLVARRLRTRTVAVAAVLAAPHDLRDGTPTGSRDFARLPRTPLGDFIRRPYNVASPRDDLFVINSPRQEATRGCP